MKCSLYDVWQWLNTFMKWILVVMICSQIDCQTVYEQKLYDTEQECMEQATIVSQYAQQQYPGTSGQVWCLTNSEFESFIKPSSGV